MSNLGNLPETVKEGFLLVDKPVGPTSHDVVDMVRRIFHTRRVGHAGTLDPFASGLLILAVGKATKEISKFVGLDKTYEATLHFGATSDTMDRTGRIENAPVIPPDPSQPPLSGEDLLIPSLKERGRGESHEERIEASPERDREALLAVLEKFRGEIDQVPPMYSAKKVGGKKLYELAREGKEIERKPVRVTIYELELLSFNWPTAVIRTRVSSGTYIRALADDIGKALGSGAYLEELRRTAIGHFKVEGAVGPKEVSVDRLFH